MRTEFVRIAMVLMSSMRMTSHYRWKHFSGYEIERKYNYMYISIVVIISLSLLLLLSDNQEKVIL